MNMHGSFIRDALRAVGNNRHEIADDGAIYIPGARAYIVDHGILRKTQF